MTDTAPPADETSKVDDIKAQAQALVENVKAEVVAKLDQLLDELGAMI